MRANREPMQSADYIFLREVYHYLTITLYKGASDHEKDAQGRKLQDIVHRVTQDLSAAGGLRESIWRRGGAYTRTA